MIQSAAGAEALPFEFFARLIWQESEFDPQAVSRAGAQGIAQFMPETAQRRGLADPFEPVAALQESAEFLHELHQQFGNWGLAAAAYNAGPRRVQDWLAKRSTLPHETQKYVQIITGRSPQMWAAAEPPPMEDPATNFRCSEIAQLVARRRNVASMERLARLVVVRESQPRGESAARLAVRPRGSARMGILAKRRGTAESPAGREQVAELVVPPHPKPRIEKIIKITGLPHRRQRIEIVARSIGHPSDRLRERVKRLAEERRPLPVTKRKRDKASRGVEPA